MITEDKVTEIFCVIDEFCKNLMLKYRKDSLKSFRRASVASKIYYGVIEK